METVSVAATHPAGSMTYTGNATGLVQFPLTQRRSPEHDAGQVRLQLPQFCTSVATSLHSPLQQTLPPVHTLPQTPQFWASVARLRQVPAQSVNPGGQTQTPP